VTSPVLLSLYRYDTPVPLRLPLYIGMLLSGCGGARKGGGAPTWVAEGPKLSGVLVGASAGKGGTVGMPTLRVVPAPGPAVFMNTSTACANSCWSDRATEAVPWAPCTAPCAVPGRLDMRPMSWSIHSAALCRGLLVKELRCEQGHTSKVEAGSQLLRCCLTCAVKGDKHKYMRQTGSQLAALMQSVIDGRASPLYLQD
jgi:hypothetical protein